MKKSDMAVSTAGFLEILLMVFLSPVKDGGRGYFSHNRIFPFAGFLKTFLGFLSQSFLLLIMKENSGSILLAIIRSLPVQSRGVVAIPKYSQQCFIRNLSRIKLNF